MSANFCDCGRALKTLDEHTRGCCNRCREAAAEASLSESTDDTEEDDLAELTIPLCMYCGAELTEDDDSYCSVECADLDRLRLPKSSSSRLRAVSL
jgi:hypothetical protein